MFVYDNISILLEIIMNIKEFFNRLVIAISSTIGLGLFAFCSMFLRPGVTSEQIVLIFFIPTFLGLLTFVIGKILVELCSLIFSGLKKPKTQEDN